MTHTAGTAMMSALLLMPVAANATDFKCGKNFVTFMYEEGHPPQHHRLPRLTYP